MNRKRYNVSISAHRKAREAAHRYDGSAPASPRAPSGRMAMVSICYIISNSVTNGLHRAPSSSFPNPPPRPPCRPARPFRIIHAWFGAAARLELAASPVRRPGRPRRPSPQTRAARAARIDVISSGARKPTRPFPFHACIRSDRFSRWPCSPPSGCSPPTSISPPCRRCRSSSAAPSKARRRRSPRSRPRSPCRSSSGARPPTASGTAARSRSRCCCNSSRAPRARSRLRWAR
ncbi:Uncharacterised protein [Burkholderia pseudomallei]|nr:Uncharacterised protein [Burkholderia pseudomallei]CAJ6206792.1 Uncharacterised protein [Burkholderia pseudomallei]VBF43574.1 Uncharacterised protein [Burkholderia pseudomallei]VBQ49058.1 Uncharacterised protein [Burkholderia pseudomallei]VCE67118.1 Uncharacterised protein [Burkholderia pseudomallei]